VGNNVIHSRFFGIGGSLLVTRYVATKPHLTAREKVLDTTLAMLRTLFADNRRGVLQMGETGRSPAHVVTLGL
jgi:hypothetical protein